MRFVLCFVSSCPHSDDFPRAVALQRIGNTNRTVTTHIPRYRLRANGRGFATDLCCPEAYSTRAEHILYWVTIRQESLAASPQTFQTFSIHLFATMTARRIYFE